MVIRQPRRADEVKLCRQRHGVPPRQQKQRLAARHHLSEDRSEERLGVDGGNATAAHPVDGLAHVHAKDVHVVLGADRSDCDSGALRLSYVPRTGSDITLSSSSSARFVGSIMKT